ncbi:MAG: DUF411 domain-containing protein [Armatimonadota bacterium]|nr:DUF411 domain-containing protein [Armatimonadota bacterium]
MTTDALDEVKHRHRVPHELASCHTAVAGRYFVEGHVPVAAIARLLREQPAIRGIALPGMPPGSPGMDGVQAGPLIVYAVSDAGIREFARF